MRALLLLFVLGFQDSDLDQLIRRLGSAVALERDSASAELLKRGKEIRPRLVQATQEADPEIAARARDLVNRIDASLDSAREFVAKLVEEEKDSYQRCLWRAYHWFNPACSGKDWFEIGPALRKQGFQDVQMSDLQDNRVEYRFRLAKDLFAASTGLQHELHLDVDVRWKPSLTGLSTAQVSRVVPRLLASARERVADAAARKPYPKGSALAEGLHHPETKKSAGEYPWLEGIEVEYLPMFDRWSGVESFRFWAQVRLVENPDLPRRSASMSIDAPSQLDAERDRTTGATTPNHVPKDELRSLRVHQGGSSEWGFDRGLVSLDNPHPRCPVFLMNRGPIAAWAFSEADVAALPESTEFLVLKSKRVNDALAEKLGRLKRLRKLEAGELGDAGLAAVAALPALEELEASVTTATSRGLGILGRATKLRTLELYEAAGFSDGVLKRLAALKELRSLDIVGAPLLSEEGLKALPTFPALERLSLSGVPVTPEGFGALARCASLRRLDLGTMRMVNADGLEALSESASLREIRLTYCFLNDHAFGRLAKIRTLEYLEAYYHSPPGTISDAGLAPFRSHPNLRALHLNKTSVTPEGTRALAESLKGKFLPY